VKFSNKEWVFFGKFFIIFSAIQFFVFTADFSLLQNFIAGTQSDFLGLDHLNNFIFVKNGIFAIVPLCTGVVSASVLAAIIFSLRKPGLKEKILVFFAGFIVLIVLNYFRVLLVVWTGKEFGIEIADWLHVLTWVSTTIFIIGIWFVFTKRITGVKNFEGFL